MFALRSNLARVLEECKRNGIVKPVPFVGHLPGLPYRAGWTCLQGFSERLLQPGMLVLAFDETGVRSARRVVAGRKQMV